MSETLKNITWASETILDKNLQKVIEGSGFWVQVIKQQMLFDPKYPTSNDCFEAKTRKYARNLKLQNVIEGSFDGQALLDDFSQQK